MCVGVGRFTGHDSNLKFYQILVSPHAKKMETEAEDSMPKTITKRPIFAALLTLCRKSDLSSSSAVTWNAWCPHPFILLRIAKTVLMTPFSILFHILWPATCQTLGACFKTSSKVWPSFQTCRLCCNVI